MTGPVTVSFKPIASAAEPDSVHVDNTKPFVTAKGEEVILTAYANLTAEDEEDEVDEGIPEEREKTGKKWVVQKVMDYRVSNGSIEFLVRWKGFTAQYDEWVQEHDTTCHALVEDFFFRTRGAF